MPLHLNFGLLKKKVRNKTVLLLTIHSNVSFSSENQKRWEGPRVSCAANITVSEVCCCLPSQNGAEEVTLALQVSIILCRKDREIASHHCGAFIPSTKCLQSHSLSTNKRKPADNQRCPTFKFTSLPGGGHRFSTSADLPGEPSLVIFCLGCHS